MMAGVSYTVEKIKGKGRRFLLLKDRIECLIEAAENYCFSRIELSALF